MVTEAHGLDGAAINKGRETRPMSVTFSDMPSEPYPMDTEGRLDNIVAGQIVDRRGAVQAPGVVTHPIVVEATTVADEFADGFTRYNRPVGGTPRKRVMLFETRNADDIADAKALGAE